MPSNTISVRLYLFSLGFGLSAIAFAAPPPASRPSQEDKSVPLLEPPSAAIPQVKQEKNLAAPEDLSTDEAEFRKQLLKVPELRMVNDLEVQALHKSVASTRGPSVRGAPKQRGNSMMLPNAPQMATLHQALVRSGQLEGLPLRGGLQARLQPSAALVVEELSKSLRDMGFVSGVPSPGSRKGLSAAQKNKPVAKVAEFQKWCDDRQIEKANAALPTLLQMLQVEEPPLRLLLVRELAKVKNRAAAIVLVQRALFDLDPEVRALAVKSLEGRPSNHYLPFLLKALRYPWPPVADHAALALRKLKTTGIEPQLIKMLEQPDPSVPDLSKKAKKPVVAELVRLNHMRNCLLCHAPILETSSTRGRGSDGLIRGIVPTPGQPLPRGGYAAQSGNFVRADTTFLHQDFSVMLTVEGADPWPAEQRFDFVVRLRLATPEEITKAKEASMDYPQRRAVLQTLRGITGKDGGVAPGRWRELLGIAKDEGR